MTTNDIYALTFVVIMLSAAMFVYSLTHPRDQSGVKQRKVMLPDSEAFIFRLEWVKWLTETATVEKGHAVYIMHELKKLEQMPGKDSDQIKDLRNDFENRFAPVIPRS